MLAKDIAGVVLSLLRDVGVCGKDKDINMNINGERRKEGED